MIIWSKKYIVTTQLKVCHLSKYIQYYNKHDDNLTWQERTKMRKYICDVDMI